MYRVLDVVQVRAAEAWRVGCQVGRRDVSVRMRWQPQEIRPLRDRRDNTVERRGKKKTKKREVEGELVVCETVGLLEL